MTKILVLAAVIIIILSGCSTFDKPESENLIETANVKSPEDFIPEGWKLINSAEGDLNGDALADIAAVIEKTADEEIPSPRILMILVQDPNESYSLAVMTETAIKGEDEGGFWGDPFDGVSIDRGTFLLSFYGGSNWRWYEKYRFRYLDEAWFLIGATIGSYFTGTTTIEDSDEEDYNLLTGDYVIKKADENGILITTEGNRGKRELVNLNDFSVSSDELLF